VTARETLDHANTEPVPVRTSPPECVRPAFAAGLACFYNEKIDLYLDGELQDRARTKFS
jgi:hypothetical protein